MSDPRQPSSPPSRPALTTLYSWHNIHPNAKVHYIRNAEQANVQVSLLKPGPVGFDLEWKPRFTKNTPENPVALVQLANHKTILLIQISSMQEFPVKLQEFLESPNIVKAGVGIQNDVKKLYHDYWISTRNCVDLSLLARSVDNTRWKGNYCQPIGLARLVATYEDLLLPKTKITRSNWEAGLSAAQQEYATNDAHAGYVIYTKLITMAKSMTTIPKAVYYSFDAVRGRLCEPSGMEWSPRNPEYDPGPPPPPKVPKPPKISDAQIAEVTATSSATSVRSAHLNHNGIPGAQRYFSSRRGVLHSPGSSRQDPAHSHRSATHSTAHPPFPLPEREASGSNLSLRHRNSPFVRQPERTQLSDHNLDSRIESNPSSWQPRSRHRPRRTTNRDTGEGRI